MDPCSTPHALLKSEAYGLLTRIDRMEPFALHVPMVPAAAIPLTAQVAIERHLTTEQRKLRAMVTGYLRWLESLKGRASAPDQAQRRYAFLRLRFIAILGHLDIFAEVMNQRSEHETGVWLSGLDVLAADALKLPGGYYQTPPVICYLNRSAGAAIRRARTRLPGGSSNPVAVIQMPRERMIGSGIGSSLVHEVGHQAAALLDLLNSVKPVLQQRVSAAGRERAAWQCWNRWISEIVSDLWSVAKLGVTATVGLMSVVSLPRAFMFRIDMEDPHPSPWIRVKLSCAMGAALYPHPQWENLARVWEAYYPRRGLAPETEAAFAQLESAMPEFVQLLLRHRPARLKGRSLAEALRAPERLPERLRELYEAWRATPGLVRRAPPSLAVAVIGQAKMDGTIAPYEESALLADLLRHWALQITLDTSAICAMMPTQRTAALAV
ncbi:hypothetical protein [Geomonas sp.]|uniref:hypothetical protein n=1 Tax=Geomonas sp. TaxID=2651584 RepID=UPI002B479D95|nr:hypothetical protein [Geomonas sp.]HJV36395.1 hypothetical protein [Geomonas sp.]